MPKPKKTATPLPLPLATGQSISDHLQRLIETSRPNSPSWNTLQSRLHNKTVAPHEVRSALTFALNRLPDPSDQSSLGEHAQHPFVTEALRQIAAHKQSVRARRLQDSSIYRDADFRIPVKGVVCVDQIVGAVCKAVTLYVELEMAKVRAVCQGPERKLEVIRRRLKRLLQRWPPEDEGERERTERLMAKMREIELELEHVKTALAEW